MKLGPVNGNAEEIRDLLENNGMKLEDYFEKPPVPMKTIFIIIPVISLFLVLIVLVLFNTAFNAGGIKLLYIVAFAIATWLTVIVQIKFKNVGATICAATGTVVVILIAAGLISPREVPNIIKGISGK
jgi:hypothetical protein